MIFTQVLDKVKHELSVFSNFQAVVNKSETDGTLELIISMLAAVVRSEIDFTIKGWFTRAGKNEEASKVAQRQKTHRKQFVRIQGEHETDTKFGHRSNMRQRNR